MGHQDVYVTSTVVTDQIYFPRTLTDGSGAPTSVPCLQQTPAEVSMTGLIREAWEFNNRIIERRSSSTETQSPAWLCSTTIMEMVLNGTMLLVPMRSLLSVRMWRVILPMPDSNFLKSEYHNSQRTLTQSRPNTAGGAAKPDAQV